MKNLYKFIIVLIIIGLAPLYFSCYKIEEKNNAILTHHCYLQTTWNKETQSYYTLENNIKVEVYTISNNGEYYFVRWHNNILLELFGYEPIIGWCKIDSVKMLR